MEERVTNGGAAIDGSPTSPHSPASTYTSRRTIPRSPGPGTAIRTQRRSSRRPRLTASAVHQEQTDSREKRGLTKGIDPDKHPDQNERDQRPTPSTTERIIRRHVCQYTKFRVGVEVTADKSLEERGEDTVFGPILDLVEDDFAISLRMKRPA